MPLVANIDGYFAVDALQLETWVTAVFWLIRSPEGVLDLCLDPGAGAGEGDVGTVMVVVMGADLRKREEQEKERKEEA